MGIAEVAVFMAARQLSQAVAAYLAKIQPLPASKWASAAVLIGQQVASNAATAFGYAVDAASNEFANTQNAEKKVVQQLASLPPIS